MAYDTTGAVLLGGMLALLVLIVASVVGSVAIYLVLRGLDDDAPVATALYSILVELGLLLLLALPIGVAAESNRAPFELVVVLVGITVALVPALGGRFIALNAWPHRRPRSLADERHHLNHP